MQLQRAPLTRNSDGVLRCAAQKQPQSGSSSRPRRKQQSVLLRAATEKASKKSSYPEEELELDGFLPLRKPGAFPSVASATHDEFQEAGAAEEEAPYDPLRDGPLRYLGYANECGEAFAAWIPAWGVPFSYGVAISYVLVDTGDKGLAAHREAQAELGIAPAGAGVNIGGLTKLLAAERTMDTLVWQMLASVIIPGYTIHTIVAAVHAGLLPLEATQGLLDFFASAAPAVGTTPEVLLGLFDRTLPTMVGLGAIPFIVHPIDEGVHLLLNNSLRPAMKRYICANGGAAADLELCKDCQTAEECEMSIDE